MQSLKDWTLTLSVVTIVSALVSVLIGQGQSKRMLRVLCAVALLSAAVLPLQNRAEGIPDFASLFPDDAWEKQQFQQQAEQAALLAAETALQNEIKAMLRQNGFGFSGVTVQCETLSDGIAPRRISLDGTWNEAEKSNIRSLLQPLLTKETTLIFLAEDNDGD